MYIKLDKIKDEKDFVFYRFSVDQWELETIKNDYVLKTKYGYCKFNKQTEEFELDKEKTDPYFTEKSREVIKVQVNLIRRKRENLEYPEIIDIATGG